MHAPAGRRRRLLLSGCDSEAVPSTKQIPGPPSGVGPDNEFWNLKNWSTFITLTHATPGIKALATVKAPTICTYINGVSRAQSYVILGASLFLTSSAPHPRHCRMGGLHGNNQPSSLVQQSPIFHLPPELLYEIFSVLASRGPLQLRHALFVCKHWHNVIISYQKLWCTVILDWCFVDCFKLCSRSAQITRAVAYIRACLNRSAPLPLDVTLNAHFEDMDGVRYCLILDPLFNSGEPRHIQRCRSLSWCIEETFSGMYVVSTLLPPSLERLEYLFLKDFSFESDPRIRLPQCPRLKEVHLVNHLDRASPNYFLDRDHTSRVEKLTYTCVTGWIDHDIPYIQVFHGIHTLVLEDATPLSSYAYTLLEEVENTSIAYLHSLETLKLIGLIPLDIIRRLHAPILRRVEIATGDSPLQSHSLGKVPLVLLQSVTEMVISIRLSDPSTPPDPQHLRRVICGAPSLNRLTGTFGIGELLAGEGWFRERDIVYHCL